VAPIHARRSKGTVEPFTVVYFVGVTFYALVVIIGVGAIDALIDQHIGIPIVEKYRQRLLRIPALLIAVSFVLPSAVSAARSSVAN
jgi:hypothetical protein